MSVEALIVAGEASESDEEIFSPIPPSKETPPSESRRLSIGGLGVGGLSLSAVTASVGKQIGAISGLEINSQTLRGNSNEERTVQHQTLLHKKLYERNAQIQHNIKQYFEGLFEKNITELSKINSECFTISTYVQETAQSLKMAVDQTRQIDESMKNISDTFSQVNLPKRKKYP